MTVTDTDAPTRTRRLPGVEGVWVFVGADSVMFAVLFGSFMAARAHDPLTFEMSQRAMNPTFGGINTLILLTSSWFVILGVRAAQRGDQRAVPRWLGGAIICGIAFVISKAIEYTEKISAGLYGNDFYMYYYSLTGLHLVHVTAGTVILTVMWRRARAGAYTPGSTTRLESGATYWHMVDYLWVLIFPLLYLLR
jgi:nitric oxide reductase NorE protein